MGFLCSCLAATSARTTALAPPPGIPSSRAPAVDLPVDAVVKGPGLYRDHNRAPAALDTIRLRRAPGTVGKRFGLPHLYGGGPLPEHGPPPRCRLWSGANASAAAGAYQFLPATWRAAQSRLACFGVFDLPARIRPPSIWWSGRAPWQRLIVAWLCDRTHRQTFARMGPAFPMVNGAAPTGSRPKTASALRLFPPADAGNQAAVMPAWRLRARDTPPGPGRRCDIK